MRKIKQLAAMCTLAVAAVATFTASAKTCTWTAQSGNWADSANWADGAVPEDGDSVDLVGSGSGGVIQLQGGATAALAGILNANTNSGWTLTDGTVNWADGTVVLESAGNFKMSAQLASPDTTTFVKRGAGSLFFYTTNTALRCAFVVEGGRILPVDDLSFGVVPGTLRADAITLRGGTLFNGDAGNLVTIAPTRGVTVDGLGYFAGRAPDTLVVASPITGNGDVCVLQQSGAVRFDAANTYTGETVLGDTQHAFKWGIDVNFSVGADGALPATTRLSSIVNGARLSLDGTTQRIAGLDGGVKLAVNGPGTLRFGAADDGALSLTNVSLATDATLAYAGAGALDVNLTSAATGTTFRLDSGTLALNASNALGTATLSLYDGAAVTVGTGVLPNLLVLDGAASVTATEPVRFAEGVSGGTTLTLAGDQAYTFGTADGILRPLDATPSPQGTSTVTLDGWLATTQDVSSFAKTADCVVFTTLTPGDQTVGAGESIGISSTSQTGTGGENIAVAGGTVAFAAEDTLAASYAITVSDNGVLAFGGLGTNDFSNATFAGSGTMRLLNGTTVLKGGFASFAISGEGGDIYVSEGETVTLADASGAIGKVGPGTLVFAGSSDNTCTLAVKEGTVRLAASAVAVKDVTVEAGATLVLDGDEQIANNAHVTVRGTFDLNGHTETVQNFGNAPTSSGFITSHRDASAAAIVNTSAEAATLATRDENAFFGRVTENPGSITIKSGSNMTMFAGPAGTVAPSRIVTSGVGRSLSYTRWSTYLFYFHAPRRADQTFALSEIQLTRGGVPIPLSSYGSAAGSSRLSTDHPYSYLFDGRADTYWEAADVSNVYVSVTVPGYDAVDGYRFAASGSTLRAPKDWDVYVFRASPIGWVRIDSRRNEKAVGKEDGWSSEFGQNLSTNYLFSQSGFIGEPIVASTEYELNGSQTEPGMRISSLEPFLAGKVSGTRNIRLEDGSAFAPADLTDWTGKFLFQNVGRRDRMARILLSSERGGPAEQAVRITETNANVSVENAGAQPVAVLIDDAYPSDAPLYGRLADGNGQLGLVKRGAGTRTLETQDAAYTGPTVVHAGTLKVVGPLAPGAGVTARYLRIHPTKNNNGYDTSHYNWGMNDFQLLDANGERIAFPSGTSVTAENGFLAINNNLIDGDISNRCLVKNTAAEESAKTGYCSWVVIDTKSSVTFYGYRWYTAHNHSADQNRVPVKWTIEVSDDGETWTTVDTGNDPYTLAYGTGNNGYPRGPYGLRGESTGASPLYTIPDAFFADVTARSTRAPALKARHFRFTPHATLNPAYDSNAFGWQVSEFSLYRDGARVDWPAGTTPRQIGGVVHNNNSALSRFCDNVITGGMESATQHRCFVTKMPSCVTVDAGEELTFDAYTFFSTADTYRLHRLPTAWTLAISTNGTDWCDVDSRVVSPDALSQDMYAPQGMYSVGNVYPLLSATAARNSIGDESPVTIDSGATLAIAAAYEKFGTLSGAGTLELVNGATAEINAIPGGSRSCATEPFSGTVSGSGTLVGSGVATQTFANASLTGVTTLELNGGVVTGTASVPGALTVACGGGTWFGTLAAGGALTVTGAPVIGLPSDPGSAFRKTLFTYTSIDAVSAAALAAATFDTSVTLPKNLKPHVNVGATSCVLTVTADGTIVIFR
ncbi:MAG: autotransporter-associated beta strand repeat-containing protein [Kiritimatiellae bacterium]|nr:autotransporter-associated beta strand repeat-containing protein [Kiritimatiellia bacterium]